MRQAILGIAMFFFFGLSAQAQDSSLEVQCSVKVVECSPISDCGSEPQYQCIQSDCEFVDFQWTVYNRWGTAVFETNDSNALWVGRDANDAMVPAGSYVYLLEYTVVRDGKEVTEQQQGIITLIYG